MYCSKCGVDIGDMNFCTECGTAACPPSVISTAPLGPYPPPPEPGPVKKVKKMDLAKRTKLWTVAGWVMLIFGAWRFVANIVGLSLAEDYKPSVFDYSIFDNSYESALRDFRLLKALAGIAIILYLAMMIAGLAIIIVNRKKTKEQK